MKANIAKRNVSDIKPSQRLCGCGNPGEIARPMAKPDGFGKNYYAPDPDGERLCWGCYRTKYRKPDWRDQICDGAAVDGASTTLRKMRDLLEKYRHGNGRSHR